MVVETTASACLAAITVPVAATVASAPATSAAVMAADVTPSVSLATVRDFVPAVIAVMAVLMPLMVATACPIACHTAMSFSHAVALLSGSKAL
ncbi:hypothetical protein Barb4_03358 [Bacteroidales bacterium Barb4]|nr:hypothetical protein Barb4_03358 [Bacteroidales bacterium Barb4]